MVDKRVKNLQDGEIEFKGIIYPGFSIKKGDLIFDIKRWEKHWENIIEKIENSKLEIWQINDLFDEFKTDLMCYGSQMAKEHQLINELGAKLRFAFDKAYSNYRDSRNGFWGFVAGLFTNKTLEKIDINSLIPKK